MKHYQVDCVGCGAKFVKHRVDKQFCSKACQMRAYRRLQKKRLNQLESLVDRLIDNKPKMIRDLFAQRSFLCLLKKPKCLNLLK